MTNLKEYLKFLGENATEEMKNIVVILTSIVCLLLIATITFIFLSHFKSLVYVIGYMLLGLLCIAILYIIVKAVYDFIKLTIDYKNKK